MNRVTLSLVMRRHELHHDTAGHTDEGHDQGRSASAGRASLPADEPGLPGVDAGGPRQPHGQPQAGLTRCYIATVDSKEENLHC